MLLALLALALLAAVLLLTAALGAARKGTDRRSRRRRRPRRRAHELVPLVDPGRERRAEQRARELLRSCVNDEEWAMYRDLGFIRVFGRARARGVGITQGEAGSSAGTDPLAGAGTETVHGPEEGGPAADDLVPAPGESTATPLRPRETAPGPAQAGSRSRYAYLIYPHKPVLAFEPESRRLLSEYCVEFPDWTDVLTGSRLPDSDDVLAKWMALTGDEGRLLGGANMHLPGRQLDPGRVRRDLWRLEEWERRRRTQEASPR